MPSDFIGFLEYICCESFKHNGPNNHLPPPPNGSFLNTKKRCKIICFTRLSYNLVHQKKGVQKIHCCVKFLFPSKRMTSSHVCLTFVRHVRECGLFRDIPHSLTPLLACGSFLFILLTFAHEARGLWDPNLSAMCSAWCFCVVVGRNCEPDIQVNSARLDTEV